MVSECWWVNEGVIMDHHVSSCHKYGTIPAPPYPQSCEPVCSWPEDVALLLANQSALKGIPLLILMSVSHGWTNSCHRKTSQSGHHSPPELRWVPVHKGMELWGKTTTKQGASLENFFNRANITSNCLFIPVGVFFFRIQVAATLAPKRLTFLVLI